MKACTEGKLAEAEVTWSAESAATVVMAAAGYPGSYKKGAPISAAPQDAAGAMEGVTVYHAGTKADGNGGVVCNGGRVLAVTGVGADLKQAVSRAYAAVGAIKFECEEGAMYRKDIAAKASIGVLARLRTVETGGRERRDSTQPIASLISHCACWCEPW